MKRAICILLCFIIFVCTLPFAFAEENEKEITFLFTHDIHDYLYPTATYEDGKLLEHGGVARLKTLINQNTDENTIYVDGGDFSMGTLYQTKYFDAAYELRNLGLLGCAVTTFGNHEFDYGADKTAEMLRSALASGDKLPQIVQSNIDFSGKLTDGQKQLKSALKDYGAKDYTIIEKNGLKIGFFGLVGLDCIECIQTDLKYENYIKAAKKTVKNLKSQRCDMIVALSHAGTDGKRKTGEDIDLAKEVEGIDLIISAHSHSTYDTPVDINGTKIVSCGEYLKNLGKITFSFKYDKPTFKEYNILHINSSVSEDAETVQRMEKYKNEINKDYLAKENVKFDDVICHSNFNLISVNEMYATHGEYTIGNIIADAYLYEAEQNGIEDIDVALVGLGTIRGSVKRGDITVADAFEICSLGVGADGSAGHPLVAVYITGKELKLLTELDASLGTLESSIKMSYSGLEYKFNTKRVILDRVTDVHLVKDGKPQKIEDEKLYKVCANMYAANMLGMLNGLTKGLLSITPKDQSGKTVKDFYKFSLYNKNGDEVKEWVALKNYLSSFDKNENGISELPQYYQNPLGRKVKISDDNIKAVMSSGAAVNIIPICITLAVIAVLGIIYAVVIIIHNKKSKEK